ncbi:MAG: hypothetical protein JHD16_10065 [Solirubrobacteraceae bacterium]|nr:hypothetical protein [Solirubrobacteraceae bacterium]
MLIRSLIALSLSAVALAGCGGDDPEPVATPAPATTPAASTPQAAGPAQTATVEPAVEPEGNGEKKSKKAKDAPEWVNSVNARCKQYQDDTTKLMTEFSQSGSTSPDAVYGAMDDLVPLGKKMVSDLRSVDVPGDLAQQWTGFLDTLNGAFDLMPKMAKSLSAGKEDEALMTEFQSIEKKTRPFAEEHGLSECLAG